MKSLSRLFVGLLLLANLLLLASLSVHVVHWPGGYTVVSKTQLSLIDTYADTNKWLREDLVNKTALVSRLQQAGQGRTIAHLQTVSTASSDLPSPSPLPDAGGNSSLFDMKK